MALIAGYVCATGEALTHGSMHGDNFPSCLQATSHIFRVSSSYAGKLAMCIQIVSPCAVEDEDKRTRHVIIIRTC